MRFAIYFTPLPDTDLTRLGAGWLGRDAFTGAPTRRAEPDIDALVAEPARYGFHATMKAPFRLAAGHTADDLGEALAAFTAQRPACDISRLVLRQVDGFLALVPGEREPALETLATDVVQAFEPFRAPLSEAELARRRPERLTERQREFLHRYGYPFVLDEFRFHMTLTGRLDGRAEAVEHMLVERLAPVLNRPQRIDALSLFVEPERGAPFRVHARHAFQSLVPEPSVHA